jgi:hypothetical protein
MLGTAWAIQKPPVWIGVAKQPQQRTRRTPSSESDTASVVSETDSDVSEPVAVLGGAGGPSPPEPEAVPFPAPTPSLREIQLSMARHLSPNVILAVISERLPQTTPHPVYTEEQEFLLTARTFPTEILLTVLAERTNN